MKKVSVRYLSQASSLLVLMLAAIAAAGGTVAAQESAVQVIDVAARKYEFSPSPVRIKAGTKVQLKLKALDHDHGFKIAASAENAKVDAPPGLIFTAPQECLLLKKGETATVEFVAQTRGTYEFKCCHTCGLGHRGMKGRIVVE